MLELTPKVLRRLILERSMVAKVGHIGSSLCLAEAMVALYRDVLSIPTPDDPDRDRFILSKGHAALAQFAALYVKGFISESEFERYYSNGSLLGMHPEHAVNGVDFATGSLGQGLSFGVGAALAAQRQGSSRNVYVLLSDAECNEGAVWEAAMFASHHLLGNLVALIDVNGQQALGYTDDVLRMSPMVERWSAFGWDTYEVNGHDVDAISSTLRAAAQVPSKPSVLVLNTIFARGVPFMETGALLWHYKSMSEDEYQQALVALESD